MFELDPSGVHRAVPWVTRVVPWTLVAVLMYFSTVVLGVLSVIGRSVKRVWHARLFILTIGTTGLAALFSIPDYWARGVALAAALIPLALLPILTRPVSRQPRKHSLIGLTAAPCYLIALGMWVANLS